MVKKIFSLVILAFLPTLLFAQEQLRLIGTVKAAITNQDLTQAKVILLDNQGNPADTILANQGITYRDGQMDTTSMFYFAVPRVDSTYVFDVVCPGYRTRNMSFTVDNIGKRERYREIPVIYLSREVQLSEVTVKATKIKFYNDGDTIVYDAGAFQLPEGSMLDALISQLPGVELSTDGQIKVNGQYVESLLLDGKKFFDSDNNLMLENIAAYTVKNIKVYEGVSKEDEALGKLGNKVLTMDVRLKKEYSIGWLVNAQGGVGTDNRYMGRLFAAWFNPKWRISLIGNANNLNDNRQPGRNDTWTPDQMPSGRVRNAIVGLEYNYENPDTRDMSTGNITVRHSNNDVENRTDRTNFLSGGNTYDKSFSNSYSKSTAVGIYNWSNFSKNNWYYGESISGSYNNSKNSSSSLAGTFTENQDSITWATLDAIYSAGNQQLLETVINRSKTMTDGWTKSYDISFFPHFGYRVPKSSDNLSFGIGGSYYSRKNEVWKDYEINYGSDGANPEKLRQYFDNTPNHSMDLMGEAAYSSSLSSKLYFYINYGFRFSETTKDSYMYALDRLEDMGIYGTVPVGYLAAFDPNNSYKSKLIDRSHSISPHLSYNTTFNEASLAINFNPSINLKRRTLYYWRNEHDYKVSRTDATVTLSSWWDCRFFLRFRKRGGDAPDAKYTNTLMYSFIMNPQLPDMFDMVDIVNDSDPLNVYIGNPGLKQQIYQRHHFRWNWMPYSYTVDNTFYFNYMYTINALTRGYTYDTSTGVRYNRMYNVSGNRSYMFTNELKWQFGSSKQFTIDSYSEIEVSQYSDMIGVDLQEPSLTKVHNRRITQNTKFSWKIGPVNLGLRCDLANRYTTSEQIGFNTLNATHVNSGLNVQANLPAGFALNTDFMCYTRRGYGVDYLDTNDPVWNIRLSYAPPRNKKWLFMVDGFDMLHTLNNVSYAVNASGRTVSYTNVLPRYFLLSVQYRLNLQPRRR